MAKLFGGRLERGRHREYGRASIIVVRRDKLLDGLPDRFNAWMSHGEAFSQILVFDYHNPEEFYYGLLSGMEEYERAMRGPLHPMNDLLREKV